ncbi:hypothetical protein G5B37_15040 [Rasiella rasia]|uniref:Uncharacterized protein n=1 Tax=Rasiella rasia TaxID=2744027 RepID=A0A6G6GHE8_9FLAO|nr:DUF6090 family protein [Rasiella rasia]QIE58005.1 hypothetical protein G5B37_15040 [Rasiella rasia]
MPIFTKSLKLTSLSNKRLGRYILYAIGEIVLVVAGILIALSINNANEANKNNQNFKLILKSVAKDLAEDTLAVAVVIENYEFRERTLKPIINGTATEAEIENCVFCGTAISSYAPVYINDKGYLQLKNFYENNEDVHTLSTEIVQFYNYYIPTLHDLSEEVKTTTINNVKRWRDNYPWFSNIVNNKSDERYIKYLKSEEFRNTATYFNMVACLNYKEYLEQYKREAKEILEAIASFEE